MRTVCSILFASLIGVPAFAQRAPETDVSEDHLTLQRHEPNVVGINLDEGDDAHLDFLVSLKFQLTREPCVGGFVPFVALTSRFSQYVVGADSSPVVGRRYNPELLARWEWGGERRDQNYFDIAYGHESNGQGIDSPNEFAAKQAELASNGDDPRFALKYVSRGWDYVGVTLKKRDPFARSSDLEGYVLLRYFLSTGVFQDGAEEYNAFEGGRDPGGRASYDGIGLILRREYDVGPLGRWKCALKYQTGYQDFLRNRTLRLELTSKGTVLPLAVWMRTGFNSDLASYYERSNSIGFGLEFGRF